MAFSLLEQKLIEECTNHSFDIYNIEKIITKGANINAFDEENEQSLYDEIIDFYIDRKEEQLELSNLYKVTELFLKNNLILNHKNIDSAYFIPYKFKFLPPDKVCVDIFKILLSTDRFSFYDIENIIDDNALDLHLNQFYFYEGTRYSKKDSLDYFLELIYWACAYSVKKFPEKSTDEIKEFKWFDRKRNEIKCVFENRSTTIIIKDLVTGKKAEIQGWTMKY